MRLASSLYFNLRFNEFVQGPVFAPNYWWEKYLKYLRTVLEENVLKVVMSLHIIGIPSYVGKDFSESKLSQLGPLDTWSHVLCFMLACVALKHGFVCLFVFCI